MITVETFTFNPFSENTYLLTDNNGNGLLIDPGMYFAEENNRLFDHLQSNNITLKAVWLTHAHLDHVFGVNWLHQQFGLTPLLHADDHFIYEAAARTGQQYGIPMQELIPCELGLENASNLEFGGAEFKVFHTPGHSPGSVCFYNEDDGFVIGGDVLFQGSIGRTDLPGGDFDTLMTSIRSKLYVLPDDVVVYSGHGPITTIGQEKISNPFVTA